VALQDVREEVVHVSDSDRRILDPDVPEAGEALALLITVQGGTASRDRLPLASPVVDEVHLVRSWNSEGWTALRQSPVMLVSGLFVLLSNLLSNVSAVLLFKPLMEVMMR
jgi:hypothetical protein